MTESIGKPVQKLKGEYVTRRPGGKSIWHVDEYCRVNRKWQLTHSEDINQFMYVKSGGILYLAEDY